MQNLDIYIGIVGHFWTIQSILCLSKNLTNSINQRSNTKKQIPTNTKSCTMNMTIKFKKFQNKMLVHMNTFDVTIDHILVNFVGSKLGLYVSFRIPLYKVAMAFGINIYGCQPYPRNSHLSVNKLKNGSTFLICTYQKKSNSISSPKQYYFLHFDLR